MTHPSIKNVKWVPYNEHDELKRAIQQIDELQAVVDAAVGYIHAIEAAHHGQPQGGYFVKKALKNLHEEVAAYEELDL